MTPPTIERQDRISSRARRRRVAGDERQRPPLPTIVVAALTLLFLGVPLLSVLIRAPWGNLWSILGDEGAATALRLSLETASITTAVCVVFGTPLAWVLARSYLPLRSVIRSIALLPLVLPPVAGGIALLLALGPNGVVGRYLLRWFGLTLPFTTSAVVLAQTFVAMPFLILTVEGALRSADRGLEEAAATLGAGRWRVLRQVTLPQIAPSLAAGAVLCWARALGEFGATVLFAGSYPGRTETMPIVVSNSLVDGTDEPTALSVVLLVVSLAILIGLRDRWLRPGPAA